MANLRKCSRCKSEIDISYFGMNRKKEPYKTCDNCRKKNKQTANIVDVQTSAKTFLESYMRLPIIKLQDKQPYDIRLDAIVVLNHQIEFEPYLKRYDEKLFSYKQFTELDPVEYMVGIDPKVDYMPDEHVTPVIVKINGVSYRASCLIWFPLTDCSDAVKLKQYETNQPVYPIFIEEGQSPIPTIMNATGYKYQKRLPSTEGFITHQGYTDSVIKLT